MQLQWVERAFDQLSPAELYAILRLREEVFIVEQTCIYLDADGKDEKSHHVFALNHDGLCMACLRIPAPGVSYREVSIGRVATHSLVRGTGTGLELMRRGMAQVERLYGKVTVRISAQSYLLRFYSSFGFSPVGEEYLEDDIPHTEMLYIP
ncbi:MAG: GNAT family N-acetyltransferase [Flavobacteriales bacterium]|jgi:ElaA protein